MKKTQFGMGMGMGGGLILGIIIIIALFIGYSFIKAGDPISGLQDLLNYIMSDPLGAGILFVAGLIFGKVAFRTYM